MPTNFIPYAKQSITQEDIDAVVLALKQDVITRGHYVESFEQAIAAEVGADYAVAFCNATIALEASYFAAELTPSDRVFTSPNTFIGTVTGPLHTKTPIHFCDVVIETGNICLDSLQAALGQFESYQGRPIVVPIHFAGVAVDMRLLHSQLINPDTIIIEDAAHALGSLYPSGEKVGSCHWSDMTVFSFHPAKTITSGEGGMVTTNNPHFADRLRLYRNNGIIRFNPDDRYIPYPGYYEVHAISGNYNVTEMQGALGLSQFRRLDSFIRRRRTLISHYRRELAGHPLLQLVPPQYEANTAFHLCVARIDFARSKNNRKKLMERLASVGIQTQVHYIPLYHHPALEHLLIPHDPETTPNVEQLFAQSLTLPLHYDLSKEDISYICRQLQKFL